MRKKTNRRPEVESLESMMLLSAVAHALPNPLILTGTEHGTYKLKGTTSNNKASGSVSPLGNVKDTSVASGVTGIGKVTMTAKQGELFIELNLSNSGSGFEGTYTITGGTKALAGETGTGTVQITTSHGESGTYRITYN